MQDQELVLRFMTFYFKGIESYTGNLKNFLSSTLDDYEEYRYRESIIGSATTTKVKTYERFRIWKTCLKEVLGGK